MSQEALSRAQKALKIRAVFLRKVSAFSQEDHFNPAVMAGLIFKTQIRMRPLGHIVAEATATDGTQQDFVEFSIETTARFLDESLTDEEANRAELPQDKIYGEILGVFSATYELDRGTETADLEIFGKNNAPFHVWPYWREFLTSMTSRMLMPQIVLPMMPITLAESKSD
jgi:preprotein translocase subunit SecB